MKPRLVWGRLLSEHPFRRGALLIALALVVEYLVLPQLAGVNHALHVLGRVNVGFLMAGVALETASLASYAKLTKTLLPRGSSSLSRLWRINLATVAVSHIVPGGGASAEGLGYRLLTNEGVAGGDAALALGIQGIGSAVLLNVLWILALIVSIPLTGFDPAYAVVAVIGTLVLSAIASLVFFLARGEDRARRVVRAVANRLPFMKPGAADAAERGALHIAARIRTMAADRALLRRAVFWATINWLLDAGSLFVFLAAFGHIENPDGLFVTYGLAYVLASIPITPGGLGIVEAVLVPGLAGFGAPRAVAILGVISYRLVNFWLPIPVGAGSYLSLRLPGAQRAIRRSDELRQAIEEARSSSAAIRGSGHQEPRLRNPADREGTVQ